MAISVKWGNPEATLLIWQFKPNWQPVHFYRAILMTRYLLAKTDQFVNVVFDMQRTNTLPSISPQLDDYMRYEMPLQVQRIIALTTCAEGVDKCCHFNHILQARPQIGYAYERPTVHSPIATSPAIHRRIYETVAYMY